jgi:hypothetical protein
MVVHKIARILNGDVNFRDSWYDQLGYLQLVVNRMDRDADLLKEDIKITDDIPF